MRSMTAYAYKESSIKKRKISAEIKCYNSRFLDLQVQLPQWLSSLEARIRGVLSSKFNRGKVELIIRIKEGESSTAVSINQDMALAYFKEIEKLAKTLGLRGLMGVPPLASILSLEGVVEVEVDNCRDAEEYWPLIEPILVDAVVQAEAERNREGKHTKEDILSHVNVLEASIERIHSHLPGLEATIKENLHLRFAEFFGDKIDNDRILAETAVLLMRYGISEELSRLSAHLSEFRAEIDRNESPGKKLDFLSQEINREINTIGSKTPIIEVSRTVVEMKNALENIREQLRNVE